MAQSFRAFVFGDGVFPINHTNAADLRSAEPRATNEWVREVRAALATMSMSLPERAVNYDLMRLGGVYDFAVAINSASVCVRGEHTSRRVD